MYESLPSVKMQITDVRILLSLNVPFAIFIYFKRNALLSEVPDTDWILDTGSEHSAEFD